MIESLFNSDRTEDDVSHDLVSEVQDVDVPESDDVGLGLAESVADA